jgi:glycerol uptake facilitator-like aquaporin
VRARCVLAESIDSGGGDSEFAAVPDVIANGMGGHADPTAATSAALVAIILAVGSVSGAHLNPVVSGADAFFGGLRRVELAAYVVAQLAGAIVGVLIANVMFALPAVSISTHVRSSSNLWFSEVIATFGLLLVIFGLTRSGRGAAAPLPSGHTSWVRTSSHRRPASPIQR